MFERNVRFKLFGGSDPIWPGMRMRLHSMRTTRMMMVVTMMAVMIVTTVMMMMMTTMSVVLKMMTMLTAMRKDRIG